MLTEVGCISGHALQVTEAGNRLWKSLSPEHIEDFIDRHLRASQRCGLIGQAPVNRRWRKVH
jgi:hypothetical protein